MAWLSLRGAFWLLTMVSISSWMGSTFYILYWVPTPLCFSAFLVVPMYFAQIMSDRE